VSGKKSKNLIIYNFSGLIKKEKVLLFGFDSPTKQKGVVSIDGLLSSFLLNGS
jgi:hypothetical protein